MDWINSVREELKQHVEDMISDGDIDEHNFEEAHYHAFNESRYISYDSNAKDWMKKHGIDAFDAISYCIEYEKSEYGEVTQNYRSAEEVVNTLVYIIGYDVIPHADTYEDFVAEIKQ